jgi:hypothetical protein
MKTWVFVAMAVVMGSCGKPDSIKADSVRELILLVREVSKDTRLNKLLEFRMNGEAVVVHIPGLQLNVAVYYAKAGIVIDRGGSGPILDRNGDGVFDDRRECPGYLSDEEVQKKFDEGVKLAIERLRMLRDSGAMLESEVIQRVRGRPLHALF